MVKRFSAAFQSRVGIIYLLLIVSSIRQNCLDNASSLEMEPRFLVTLCKLMLTDSMALGGVNQLASLRRVVEERAPVRPVAPPRRSDR